MCPAHRSISTRCSWPWNRSILFDDWSINIQTVWSSLPRRKVRTIICTFTSSQMWRENEECIRYWLETLNAPRLAKMKIRLAIPLAYGQYCSTSVSLDTWNTFDWARSAGTSPFRKICERRYAEELSRDHQFKILAIFHSTGNLSTSNYNEYST